MVEEEALGLIPHHLADATCQLISLLAVLLRQACLPSQRGQAGKRAAFAYQVAVQIDALRKAIQPPTGPFVLVIHTGVRRAHPLAQTVPVGIHLYQPVFQVALQPGEIAARR